MNGKNADFNNGNAAGETVPFETVPFETVPPRGFCINGKIWN